MSSIHLLEQRELSQPEKKGYADKQAFGDKRCVG